MPRLHVTPSTAFLLPLLAAAPAGAQTEAWRKTGDVRHESLGDTIAIVADYDGDGTRDLLVGAPGMNHDESSGRVVVLSGTTLAVLREIVGPLGERFGTAVGDAGDVDGDGVADLFVGNIVPGVARVYSGATGVELLKLSSALFNDAFGSSGVGLGDLDGDGFGDVAIGAPFEQVAGVGPVGVVRIVSGATGASIHVIPGTFGFARVGGQNRIAKAGDVDGDGFADLALLDADAQASGAYSVVRVMSGATGLELWAHRFDAPFDRDFTLESVANAGDVDGDGIDDVVAGGIPVGPSTTPCRAFVFSGATGARLLEVDARQYGIQPAWMVVGPAGDVDGDLLADFVISTSAPGPHKQPLPELTLVRGSDGATIGTITGTPSSDFGRSFAGGIDSDLDGTPDLAIGEATADRSNSNVGEVRLAKWPGGNLIARVTGDASDRRFRGDVASVDDVDGDGTNDVVAADPGTASMQDDELRVLSGRDGSELLRHLVAVVPDGELVALPDQDGDGHDDVAFGESITTTAAAVEVRSSATGALLLRIPGPGTMTRFGEQLAVGIQPGGALQLAIGAPLSSAGTSNGGEVQVWDVATGTLLFQRVAGWGGEHLGNDLAYLGDVDGDGVGDWAFGAPLNGSAGKDAGRVVVVSGVAGALLQVLKGTAGDHFGERVAGVGDLDGDGVGDLGVAAPQAGTGQRGEITVHRGGAWTLLATVSGVAAGDRLGRELDVLPDVNGDGVAEWLALGAMPPRFEVRSGATTGLLALLDMPTNQSIVATPHPWQTGSANGDAIADLLFADASASEKLSQASLVTLDDLLFQLSPTTAAANDTVSAATRGGPVGGPVALEFVAFGGAPIGVLVDFSTFDNVGTWTTSDTIPPGLAGLTADFRAWAIGFSGRIVSSPVQTLTLQ